MGWGRVLQSLKVKLSQMYLLPRSIILNPIYFLDPKKFMKSDKLSMRKIFSNLYQPIFYEYILGAYLEERFPR